MRMKLNLYLIKKEIKFPLDMHAAIEKEVFKLLDKKVIEKVEESNDQVVSNNFGKLEKTVPPELFWIKKNSINSLIKSISKWNP